MHKVSRLMNVVFVLGTVVVLAAAAQSAPIFVDGFEPDINGADWQIGPPDWWGPYAHENLKPDYDPNQGRANHIRTPGINSARQWVNYNVTYNSQHILDQTYSDGVYLKVWIFEDNDIAFPGYTSDFWPNGYVTLLDTTTAGDFFKVGVIGQVGRDTSNSQYFYCCAIETASDGPVVLDGLYGNPRVQRRAGWRKYTILLNDYTGTAGDVQFLIDDKIVYEGNRVSFPGGAPVDKFILGSKNQWTNETYWYDHVDFGTIETPVQCSTLAEAKDQADGTWVELASKVVTGRFSKNPFPGYFAVEEDNRSTGLWVSSSYEAKVSEVTEEAEKVSLIGIMYTNGAGVRYLDAIQVIQDQDYADQPGILGTTIRGLEWPEIEGMLVKVWGEVVDIPGSDPATVKGQERGGDWRRYIMIDDGSDNAPIKCYYDNIISGIDPVPDVQKGDYVSVVGVAATDVLTEGGPVEKSVWIRKTGDLEILRAAP